ncbi:tRNA (guanosine(37)-N1)-methyltransferase TrmD [Geochorda subterranea]|uniref:tRNA (guanine-N(1)-)-methyltransferase n=1 Tax=Geochorda subterranea TaxID=3109564 RepID=A0ABZ1BKI9_9FIRM|nr:tRNA (guanosine(37)-N1)-methyltransferase TrmD [Limnochorda sp. LNt]WRP13356.1 tRNA (guanosine(37)-N1)-methyltransferase TrmD [Limnochorda sp. LNt]
MYVVDVVTLSPEAVDRALQEGVVGRARQRQLVRLRLWDLREFSRDPHRKVDDAPFGSGRGMVLMAPPVVAAAEHAIEARQGGPPPRVLITAANGRLFRQETARELARHPGGLVVVCGRYEGIDARVAPLLGAEEVSIGDYVLSGGEAAALVVVDAVVRLLPGVLGDPESAGEESFERGAALTRGGLEFPQYTRPRRFRGLEVPEVLLSGDHGAIARWRRLQSLRLTLERRPELLDAAGLSQEERALVEQWRRALS